MKKFLSILERMDSAIWGLILPVPKDISTYYQEQGVKRFVCTLNGQKTIHRAFLSSGDGNWFIYINKEIQKELNLRIGEKVEIEVAADESDYGMPFPEELAEGFAMMPYADKLFHQLSPGKQRTLIYMVSKPKRPETRAKKAIDIMEYLETVNGKLDFKELNEWFKARK